MIRVGSWWAGAACLVLAIAAEFIQSAYTPGSIALIGILFVVLADHLPKTWPFGD